VIKEKQVKTNFAVEMKSWLVLLLAVLTVCSALVGCKGQEADGSQTVSAPADFGQIFDLDTFVVNLGDQGGKRYLKTKIALEYGSEALGKEMITRLPQLRDMILLLLSSKTLDQIQDIDGKIALRNELMSRINQTLQQGRVKNLYFTEFVIQ
jgi:flagellar protein FliL